MAASKSAIPPLVPSIEAAAAGTRESVHMVDEIHGVAYMVREAAIRTDATESEIDNFRHACADAMEALMRMACELRTELHQELE